MYRAARYTIHGNTARRTTNLINNGVATRSFNTSVLIAWQYDENYRKDVES
jgi:hypothetical protein